MKKIILAITLMLALALPDVSFARGFSGGGGSHSSFSSGSHSTFSSSSSSRSSYSSSSSRPSSSSSSSSSSKVNLSKSSGSSFSGKTSSKSYNSAYKSSANKSMKSTSGSFSGRTSTKSSTYRTGAVYRSTPSRVYYGGHYVSVSHYYHVGYSPFGWGGYYHGFTTGMFMGSLMHPWGAVYPVHGAYTSYGPSPIAWILDVIVIGILLTIIYLIVKAIRKPKTSFTRKF